MAKLQLYDEFSATAALPTGLTTTYRVIRNGENTALDIKVEQSSRWTNVRHWLHRQHPADVVRLVMLAIAIGAVIFSVVRLG